MTYFSNLNIQCSFFNKFNSSGYPSRVMVAIGKTYLNIAQD